MALRSIPASRLLPAVACRQFGVAARHDEDLRARGPLADPSQDCQYASSQSLPTFSEALLARGRQL